MNFRHLKWQFLYIVNQILISGRRRRDVAYSAIRIYSLLSFLHATKREYVFWGPCDQEKEAWHTFGETQTERENTYLQWRQCKHCRRLTEDLVRPSEGGKVTAEAVQQGRVENLDCFCT
jgi:hypothetical protein